MIMEMFAREIFTRPENQYTLEELLEKLDLLVRNTTENSTKDFKRAHRDGTIYYPAAELVKLHKKNLKLPYPNSAMAARHYQKSDAAIFLKQILMYAPPLLSTFFTQNLLISLLIAAATCGPEIIRKAHRLNEGKSPRVRSNNILIESNRLLELAYIKIKSANLPEGFEQALKDYINTSVACIALQVASEEFKEVRRQKQATNSEHLSLSESPPEVVLPFISGVDLMASALSLLKEVENITVPIDTVLRYLEDEDIGYFEDLETETLYHMVEPLLKKAKNQFDEMFSTTSTPEGDPNHHPNPT